MSDSENSLTVDILLKAKQMLNMSGPYYNYCLCSYQLESEIKAACTEIVNKPMIGGMQIVPHIKLMGRQHYFFETQEDMNTFIRELELQGSSQKKKFPTGPEDFKL